MDEGVLLTDRERPGAPIRTDDVSTWPQQGRAEREAASDRPDRVAGDPPIRRVGIDYGDQSS